MGAYVTALLEGVLSKGCHVPITVGALNVHGLTMDSRALKPGWAFIAVPGLSVDGRDFIQACLLSEHKPVIIFCHAETFAVKYKNEVPIIDIPMLAQKVSNVAANFYSHPSKHQDIVGITGTNGKTTCAYFLSQVLASLDGACGHIGTLGSGIFFADEAVSLDSTGMTTPSPIDCQDILHRFSGKARSVVMEVSSHGLAQHRVKAVEFKGAVFTNLSRDHLDFHGSFEEYFKAKRSLFTDYNLAFAVLNLDDKYTADIANALNGAGVKVLGFGLKNNNYYDDDINSKVLVSDIRFDDKGCQAFITTPWGAQTFFAPVYGNYNLLNLAAVIATSCEMGFSLSDVLSVLREIKPVPGRLERVFTSERHKDSPAVFVDFAHTPDALENVLSQLACACLHNLWVVVGCGGDRDKGKRPLMAKVAIDKATYSVFTSDNPRSEDAQSILVDMLKGTQANKNIQVIEDRKAAIEYAIEHAGSKDTVIIAGKGHEKFQIVGNKKTPFDDVLIAQAALAHRESTYLRTSI